MSKWFKAIGVFLVLFGVSFSLSHARFGNPALANTDPQRNAEFESFHNEDDVTHEVGDVVVYKDDDHDGVDISTTTTANNSLVAGVIAVRDCPADTWCTVQTKGYHSAITVTGTVAAGDLLTTSTTGEAARAYTIADSTGTTAGQGEDFGVFAVALTADASNTVKGFIFGR